MRLVMDDCWSLVRAADHGILCTTGAGRKIDAVPVCFAVVSQLLATPVDLVKPKTTTNLSRLENLDRDASATFLCEQWDRHDWSRLWWVRAHLVRRTGRDVSGSLLDECDRALRDKYTQYRDADFAELLLFDVTSLIGWAAVGPQAGATDRPT
jgi:hypothetical protein